MKQNADNIKQTNQSVIVANEEVASVSSRPRAATIEHKPSLTSAWPAKTLRASNRWRLTRPRRNRSVVDVGNDKDRRQKDARSTSSRKSEAEHT